LVYFWVKNFMRKIKVFHTKSNNAFIRFFSRPKWSVFFKGLLVEQDTEYSHKLGLVLFFVLSPSVIYVTVYTMGKPSQSHFFRCQCLCVLLIYITCRIFCAKGHHSTCISNILWVIAFWNVSWSWKTFEVWIKNYIRILFNFNYIRCNFKALLNIFLHFGMDKMYQRGIFTIKKNNIFCYFSPFLRILPGDFGRVFP
jgi:hypothetical protein